MLKESLHPIQKDILSQLMRHKSKLNYGKLLPRELKFESDKFNYHLQFLVKEGYVVKEENGYKLTTKGLQVVSQYTAQGYEEVKLKVSVAVIVLRDAPEGKEILLQRRLRHPFYGDINSIAGKIRPGEYIIDAAKRKLKEESGLEADFTFVGVLRKCRFDTFGNILEDTLYNYCVTENPVGELVAQNEYGENFWASISEISKLKAHNFDEGEEDLEVFDKIISKDSAFFYLEQKRAVEGYTKQ